MPEIGNSTTIFDNLDGIYRDSRSHEPVLEWNYCVKGLLRRGETSVLYGPPNCGKSALVCYIGHRITTGLPCFGAPVQKGIVVHVGAEAPDSILDRMKAYPSDDETAAPYIVRMDAVDLSEPVDVESFIQDLKQIHRLVGERIVLVVFDTLARSIGTSDENCAQAMTAIADATDSIAHAVKAHVMLVHHTGKDVERGGRGSSALRGAVDTELALLPHKSGAIVLSQEKQRTMPKSKSVHFRTEPHILGQDEDGEHRTTVKAVEVTDPLPTEYRNNAGGSTGLDHALLTALHIRRMTSPLAIGTFRPRDILETLPPELFGEIAEASRVKNVSRALERLAQREPPIVHKADDGWRLVIPGFYQPKSK